MWTNFGTGLRGHTRDHVYGLPVWALTISHFEGNIGLTGLCGMSTKIIQISVFR